MPPSWKSSSFFGALGSTKNADISDIRNKLLVEVDKMLKRGGGKLSQGFYITQILPHQIGVFRR
ncbi:MAG TPA: hypothetical protein DCS30_03730 [Rhizobiales bacterium]|nr:hypothetical protein [Hyphomicrobiales bacterium]